MSNPSDPLIAALLALQNFEKLVDPQKAKPADREKLQLLREPIPVSILLHHDNRRARKKLSIAPASSRGVCGHCHLAVPRGLMLQMSRSGMLVTCPHCEGFLYLDAEPAEPAPKKKPAKKPRKAKSAAGAPSLQTP